MAFLLLLGLAARLWLRLAHAAHSPADGVFAAAALLLGGCVWWVAQRQCGQAGAALGTFFYVSSPAALYPGAATLAALGLFAMLYTAVGVAHAMLGPPRKRPPRIALMTLLTAFTAWAQPAAAYVGLLLAFLVTLYLAEGRRRNLLLFFLLWSAAAVFAAGAPLGPRRMPGVSGAGFVPAESFALAGALVLWALSRRLKYFGNSAPLLASFVLLAVERWTGSQIAVWALPFALLFLAGVFADALEGARGRLWAAFFWSLASVQLVESFAAKSGA